ncbi:MAG: TonB-dependent receptor [Acidobacteria bacterium]|nr:TonB-dependent receptor [Acidobacteriota bacterium]
MKKSLSINLIGLVLLFFGFTASPILAQATTGTILGVVKDSTGGVLPGVSVTTKNVDTGISRNAITDDGGRYRIPELGLGNYEVQAELTGFQTTVHRGITLTVGQQAVVDIVLNVGEMTERVEVTGEAPQVETTTSTIAGLVDEKKVRDLPLNARSLIELAPLKSGIVFADYGGVGNATVGFSRKLSIAGSRQNASLFQLDGANITDRSGAPGSAAGLMMGVETIREFNIVTNGYSAEYGKHTGGIFNAVTKSGTNEIHGSVFEFLRNDNLDARNFFDGADTPEYKRNQYGFSIGGPIVRNQTFFFGSWEGLKENLGITQTLNVLSEAAKQGLLPASGGQVRQVAVAESVKPFLHLFPKANGRDLGDGRAELVRTVSRDTDENFFTVRLDHNFSESDSFFGRYTMDDGSQNIPTSLNVIGFNDTRSQYLTLGETKVFSPQLINKFVFGLNRANLSTNDQLREGFTLGSFSAFKEVSGIPLYGVINVGGLAGAGGRVLQTVFEISNYYQIKDDLYVTKGKHSLKFGADIERRQDNRTQGTFHRQGVFEFQNIEDFLRGLPNSFSAVVGGNAERYFRQTIYGFYVQDDIKLKDNLTVNLGVRYEPTTELTEKYGRISTLRGDYKTRLNIKAEDAVLGNPAFENPSLRNFAPRLGLAWDPFGDAKMAIRAGFGVYHEQLTGKMSSGGDVTATPIITRRGQIVRARIPVPIDFPNAYTTQFNFITGAPAIDFIEFEPQQPYVMKWSLDVQREITPGTAVEVGYSGTRGVQLPLKAMWNTPIVTVQNGRLFAAPTAPFRHPDLGRLWAMQMQAASAYHALRLEFNRRFSNSLQAQASYTFSKSLDDSSSTNGASDFSNDNSAVQRYLDERMWGPSAFDVRNNLMVNFTYDLPGKGLTGISNAFLAGWSLSGILRLSDGHPFTAASGAPPANFSGGMFLRDLPDRNPAVQEVAIDERNPNRYFDPNAFLLPTPVGTLGNLGRNTLNAPGVATFDLVTAKNTSVNERVNIQFRAEFFNLFNRANFGLPSASVFDPRTRQISSTAGRIRNTITTSRQVQFGLKILF